MNLLDLKNKQNGINIRVVIKSIDPVREVQKGDKKLKVAHCQIVDDQGNNGYLSLWNEDVDKFEIGDIVEVINGFNHIYDGNPNLSAGISGMLRKVA